MDCTKQLTIEELRERELEVLLKFHDFCCEHNLKYWLSAGSLLGAVRHKGFIPWDDDIDVGMPREDYMKLIELFPSEGIDGIKLLTPFNSLNSPITFGKLYDSHTLKNDCEFEEKYRKYGLDIDIFPWDYAPEDKEELNRFYKKQYLRYKVFLSVVGAYRREEKLSKTIIKAIFMSICKLLATIKIISPEKIAKKMNQKSMNYPKSNCLCSSMQPLGTKAKGYGDINHFSQLVLAPFEEYEFFIPENYDIILKNIYGDYMVLPPEEKRKTHHLSNVFVYERTE